TKHASRLCTLKPFLQSATGKTQSGRRHRCPENIQSHHGDLEALTCFAQTLRDRDAAIVKTQARKGVGRNDIDTLGDFQARSVSIYHKGRNAASSRRFAGTDKQGVEIGDAAIRYPGLLAIDHVMVTVKH